MRRRTSISIFTLLFLLLLSCSFKLTYAYDKTHAFITLKALKTWPRFTAWPGSCPNSIYQDFCNHISPAIGTSEYDKLTNHESIGSDDYLGASILEGVVKEDYGKRSIEIKDDLSLKEWVDHFWDPATDETMYIYDPAMLLFNLGNEPFLPYTMTAFQKAAFMFTLAYISYYNGNQNLGYYYLGKTGHLLQDMAVPAHVNQDVHIPLNIANINILYTGDEYEKWTKNAVNTSNWGQPALSSTVLQLKKLDLETFNNELITNIPMGGIGQDSLVIFFQSIREKLVGFQTLSYVKGDVSFWNIDFLIQKLDEIIRKLQNNEIDKQHLSSVLKKLKILFYNMARASQYFPSDDSDYVDEYENDDANTNDGRLHTHLPYPPFTIGWPVINQDLLYLEDNLKSIAECLIPRAIQFTAALYELFYDEFHIGIEGPDIVDLLATETFSGVGKINGSPVTLWEWDFDYDGEKFIADKTGQTVTYAYNQWGEKKIALQATAPGQNPVRITKDIYVLSGQMSLPRTGQTSCYDSAGNVKPCPGTGQDGDNHAGVPWPDPRFSDHGDGTITDNLTGLMWTKESVNLPGAGYKTWEEALAYIAGMNSGNYLNFGYTDWRLPNVIELESLVNCNESSSREWLISQGFGNVENYYSSSTTKADPYSTTYAWVVSLDYGVVLGNGLKSVQLRPFWPVRSAQSGSLVDADLWKTGQAQSYAPGDDGDLKEGVSWPTPRFTVTGDCVRDNLTGLMWVKAPDNIRRTWEDALTYANNLTLCSFSDWRLSNRKELLSVIDWSKYNPALPQDYPFKDNIPLGKYWTSTSCFVEFWCNNNEAAWYVSMDGGGTLYESKTWQNYAWPVRGPSQTCPTPGVPSSPLPSDGATVILTNPTLSWTSTTNTDYYDVYFGTSSNPAYVGNTGSTNYPLSGLSLGTTYYWKIMAKNTCGNFTSGPVWTFKVNLDSGGVIDLQKPINGTVFDSGALVPNHVPTFTWATTGTFKGLNILYCTSPTDFTLPIVKAGIKISQSSWTPKIALWKKIMISSYNNGSIRDIYWKVIGTQPDQKIIESEVRSFRIGDSQVVSINAPPNGANLPTDVSPSFEFDSNRNIKFLLQFSSLNDFSDLKKIKGFLFTTKDPNVETTLSRTLSSKQWAAVKKVIGTGIGYFRIKAWDGISRETISEVRSFSVQ